MNMTLISHLGSPGSKEKGGVRSAFPLQSKSQLRCYPRSGDRNLMARLHGGLLHFWEDNLQYTIFIPGVNVSLPDVFGQ